MGPQARLLPCGTRLHLSHGPIDLVIGADGERHNAFEAAKARFVTVLDELVPELPVLRSSRLDRPNSQIGAAMWAAVSPHSAITFVTPMAAVAGAVADAVLAEMVRVARLRRAYVNNGGDIALHLAPGARFRTQMADHNGDALGQVTVSHDDLVRGIATSGRHGRSFSLGIADSVTVLACSAAAADVAATLIANAVDLPDHPAVIRQPADALDPDSDLGPRRVVTDCATLAACDCARALASGLNAANAMKQRGLIQGAALFLQGHAVATRSPHLHLNQRTPEYA